MELNTTNIEVRIQQDLRRRQEHWTRDITQMMVVVIVAAAMIITAGTLIGLFLASDTAPIYYLLAAILMVWLGVRGGGWRWASYFPPLLCFVLGAYGAFLGGYHAVVCLFFPLAVMLAAMVRDSRAGFITAGSCIVAYVGLGSAVDGFSVDAIAYTIVFSAAVLGVALLQWYNEVRYRQSLIEQYAINASLEGEAERRRLAELNLREQEKQLRRVYDNMTDLVAEVDHNGSICYASPSFQNVLGFAPQDLIGKNGYELLLEEDRPDVLLKAAEAGARRNNGALNLRVRRADGALVDVELSATPLYDDADVHSGFIVAGRDVTQRRQAERALQESETKFRNIIESLPLGIHIYHVTDEGDLVLTGFNPAADRILMIDHAPLLGCTIDQAFPGLSETDIPERYRCVAETGEIWQAEQVAYDENKVTGAFEVHAFRTLPGKMAAVFSDISARLRADDALRASEEKFSTAFRTSPDSININRLVDGVYIDINQGFSAIMGYTRDEVVGKSSLELDIWLDPADRARLVRELRAHGVMENLEARFRRKNGEIVVGLMSARIITVQGESCILSITRDITERISSEAELRATHAKLEQAYENTLVGWARALELRERETANHSQRVVEQTVAMASALGCTGKTLENIQRGAMLHDIGKLGVPDNILLKPGPLTDDEWVTMRQHVDFAREMLMNIEYLHACMDIPCYHHERWDGSGYPNGLKGEEIPLPARIFAVVDVYDALTHDRPYRPAWSAAETRRYLREQSGKQFDPTLVDLFFRMQGTGRLG